VVILLIIPHSKRNRLSKKKAMALEPGLQTPGEYNPQRRRILREYQYKPYLMGKYEKKWGIIKQIGPVCRRPSLFLEYEDIIDLQHFCVWTAP
jgi:hypothetical protein